MVFRDNCAKQIHALSMYTVLSAVCKFNLGGAAEELLGGESIAAN